MTPKTAEVLKAFGGAKDVSTSTLKIQIMLAIYSSPAPETVLWRNALSSQTGKTALSELFDDGLIDEHQRPTERGDMWVKYICATPLPVQGGWVLPERAVEP